MRTASMAIHFFKFMLVFEFLIILLVFAYTILNLLANNVIDYYYFGR